MTGKDEQFREDMKKQALDDNATIWERLDTLGVPHLRAEYPRRKHYPNYQGDNHLSSLDLALISEETGKSVYWIITGEPDPYEVRVIACNLSDMDY